jgi:hypothetical protein
MAMGARSQWLVPGAILELDTYRQGGVEVRDADGQPICGPTWMSGDQARAT